MGWNRRFLPDDPEDFDLLDTDDESKHELRRYRDHDKGRSRRRKGHPYHKLKTRESDLPQD
jgi:hypothetical protein